MNGSHPLAGFAAEDIAMARRGRTWPMLFVKQALAELPAEQAYAEFASALQRPSGSALVRKQLLGIHPFAQEHAAFLQELEPGGEPFVNLPPRVIGEGDQRVLNGQLRPTYLAAFDGVTTRGRSQLIETKDAALLDFENEELARIDDVVELDSAVFRRDGDAVWVIDEPNAESLQIEQCFSLLGPNSFAFGHWIVEYLPRIWLAQASGLMPRVPVLIDQDMPRQHREALELLLSPGTDIIEIKPMQRVEVGRLWFAPLFYYRPIYPQFNRRFRYDFAIVPPDRFRRIMLGMIDRLSGAIGPDPACADTKIYLARKAGGRRKLVNHEVIESIAQANGFRHVFLEDLGFVEQLRLIRSADYLLGPEGSAFFLGFFARPGTRIAILNHRHTEYLTTVTALLEKMEMDCTVLTGPFQRVDPEDYLHHSDYRIEPEELEEFLRGWCG